MKSILNSKIVENEKQLLEYLSDFEPIFKDSILLLFTDDVFNCGYFVFRSKMRSMINMPCNGKATSKYWLCRGWDEKNAEAKRTKVKNKKSPMTIGFWISKGLSEEEAKLKIKSQRKMNVEYWVVRGHSIEDATRYRSEYQNDNAAKMSEKLKIMRTDENSWAEYISKKTNNIEYWLALGFNTEEASLKLKERQATFTLDKCINKLGIKDGTIRWQERQLKWQNSLKSGAYDGKSGKSLYSKIDKNKSNGYWS